MKIGILGSSFNPPHKGHLEISNRALTTFSLNEVWWLITKVNPLKNSSDYIPLNERKNKIDEITENKNIKFKYYEEETNSNYLIDNLKYIKEKFSKDTFIFLMGSDSLNEMHEWKEYESIFKQIPIAVFNRQDSEYRSLNSKAAKAFEKYRIDDLSKSSIFKEGPSWTFIQDFDENISSTEIRSKID